MVAPCLNLLFYSKLRATPPPVDLAERGRVTPFRSPGDYTRVHGGDQSRPVFSRILPGGGPSGEAGKGAGPVRRTLLSNRPRRVFYRAASALSRFRFAPPQARNINGG